MKQPREQRMSSGLKAVIATRVLFGRCHTHEHTPSGARVREPLVMRQQQLGETKASAHTRARARMHARAACG